MKEKYLIKNLNSSIRIKGLLLLVILIFTSVFLQHKAYCADVVLAWNPNTEEDLAGYIIYYGTSSRVYDQEVDVGNVTTYTISELDEGVFYYFSATAYDFSGNESDYSNEVTYFVSLNSTALDSVQDDTADNGPASNENDYSDESRYVSQGNSSVSEVDQNAASDSNTPKFGSDVGGCFIFSLFSYKRVMKR